ncbi:hypothetical protein WKU26_00330 [Phocaeicola sp. HCN-40430]|uniref:hypothetical protein n=1 Tax=Phocaeicola sp. HCN-40430 TaxID=3134664 RepID=UPI0030C0BCF6
MNKLSTNKVLFGLWALSLFGMVSCVDNDYDLSKDIDMSVTVGGNDLSIPASDTKNITLEKIFDLEEGSAVQADSEGNYSLLQHGEGSDSKVSVDKVVIEGHEISTESQEVWFDFKVSVPGELQADIETKNTVSLDKTDLTRELVSLSSSKINMPAWLNVGVTYDKPILLKQGTTITFPSYYTVSTDDSRCILNGKSQIVFNQDVQFSKQSPLNIHLSITEIRFSAMEEGKGLIAPGHLIIEDDIKVKGTASVEGGEAISVGITTQFRVDRIEMLQVTGMIDPDITVTIAPIQIENLPDFLKDETVRIDMTDPRIFLTVSNDSPVSVDFSAVLKSFKDGSETASVMIGGASAPIMIPAGQENYVICLHRQQGNVNGADESITVANLNDLIQVIPDEIRMESIEARAAQEEIVLNLGEEYTVKTDYEINAPLQFNEGTTIVYNDSFDGWKGDLDDLYIKELVVSMDATNTIPLEMQMAVDAVDAEGNILDNVTAVVSENIQAGTLDNPVVTSLNITLKTSNPEAFQKLDGLKYSVSAHSSAQTAGQVLNKEQHLRLDKMVIKVKGGVTVDLN